MIQGQSRFLRGCVALMALLVAGMLVQGAVQVAEAARDDAAALARLRRPVPRVEGGRHLFRARLDGRGAPLCRVEQRYEMRERDSRGRERRRTVVGAVAMHAAGASIVTADGRALALGTGALRFDPADLRPLDAWPQARGRVVVAPVYQGGWVEATCVAPGEPLFVDACLAATGDALAPCTDGAEAVLTRGDGSPQRRVRVLARALEAELALGLAALATLALAVWVRLRRDPLLAALGVPQDEHTPDGLARLGWRVGLSAAVVCALGLAVSRWIDDAWTVADCAGLLAVAFAGWSVVGAFARSRECGDARSAIGRVRASSLAAAEAGRVAVAVHVRGAGEAAVSHDGRAAAWVQATLVQIVQEGRVTTRRVLHTAASPARIAVDDASGAGVLDLSEATVDLAPRVVHITDPTEAARVWAHYAPAKAPAVPVAVELRTLAVNEALWVLADAERAPDPGAEHASFRTAATRVLLRAAFVRRDDRGRDPDAGLRRAAVRSAAAGWGLAAATALAVLALGALRFVGGGG
jgi:hypothetical protein